MANTDRLSVFISAMLDSMGFSRHMIDFRINNISHINVLGVLQYDTEGYMVSGGKAEGTSMDGQGDTDIMYVLKFITVSSQHINPPSPNHAVLYTEDNEVHRGYTWLRVGHRGQMDNFNTQAVSLTVGPYSKRNFYLSSSAFNQLLQRQTMQISPLSMQHQHISGPSQPVLFEGKPVDNVYAFPVQDWPAQASHWMERCGTNGWPPQTIVTAIVQSGCHIVPKGFKGSPSNHMEWCFSFVVHEKSILQLFNMTQKHFYILLKIMAKDLKERFPALQDVLTSYTMKTVALWQVELHHTRDWDRLHVLDRVMEALSFLKSCVESQNLPAYFIPENNLFDGKLNPCTADLLSGCLNTMLSQGISCVLTFPSIQQQLHIMQIPGLRQNFGVYCSGLEMMNIMDRFCCRYLCLDLSMKSILHFLSLINLPDMTRHRLLTNGVSKIMKATLAYVNIAKIMNARMSNRRKYELCQPLLIIASTNSKTDRMAGIIKFAGALHVLGQTTKAIETLYSIKLPLLFGTKCHFRYIVCKMRSITEKDSDNAYAAIARLGRDNFVQQCISLDVRYTKEEMGIVPNVIKYELFHFPEIDLFGLDAYIDPDMLRYYLLYKCHTELGDEQNAQGAFNNLIRISTQGSPDPLTEYPEVALNVLGRCYLEKEDYLKSYICFRRAMSLRPMLLVEKWSTSTPWHLAVLASKLINR